MSAQSIESEACNNLTGERGERRVGYLRSSSHDEEDPCFGILEELNCLVLLEMLILDTLAVSGDAVDCNSTLLFIEEPGCRWTVWQPDEADDALQETERAKDDKDVHPSREARCDVPDSIPEKASYHSG